MEIPSEIMDRAQRGAALLDRDGPTEWVDRINLDELDIKSQRNCILGQLGQSEMERRLGGVGGCLCLDCWPASVAHGFDTERLGDAAERAEYAQLTEAWKRVITARRDVVCRELTTVGWLLGRDGLTMVSPDGTAHDIPADIKLTDAAG